MFKSILFAVALTSGVGMPCAFADEVQPIEEKVEFKQENKKFVSYDDENFIISLSSNEVSDYYFHNFVDLCLEYNFVDHEYVNDVNIKVFQISSDGVNFSTGRSYNTQYSKISFDIDNDTAAAISWDISAYNTRYDTNFESYKFFNDVDDTDLTIGIYFKPNVTYAKSGVTESDIYNALKHAIELDIQANSQGNQPFMQPVLQELVSLLVSGITAFAGGIGTGVSTLVSDIFINNGHLSVFGSIIAIFGGIALAIGLSRWVMNYLTSLGAKK